MWDCCSHIKVLIQLDGIISLDRCYGLKDDRQCMNASAGETVTQV